jgi:hypothetical protein
MAENGRWEYMTMTYNYSYGATTYEVNGNKEGKLKNRPIHEVLTIFGQYGWELTGIGEDGKLYILKRPATRAASTNGESGGDQ